MSRELGVMGLFLGGEYTNLIKYSEDLTNAVWSANGLSTLDVSQSNLLGTNVHKITPEAVNKIHEGAYCSL